MAEVTVTTSYDQLPEDQVIRVDSSSGPVVVQLLSDCGITGSVRIEKVAGAHPVVILGVPEANASEELAHVLRGCGQTVIFDVSREV